jgi:hypothetical protein
MLKIQQPTGNPDIHIVIRDTPNKRGVEKIESVHTWCKSYYPSVGYLQITIFACTNKKQEKRTAEMPMERFALNLNPVDLKDTWSPPADAHTWGKAMIFYPEKPILVSRSSDIVWDMVLQVEDLKPYKLLKRIIKQNDSVKDEYFMKTDDSSSNLSRFLASAYHPARLSHDCLTDSLSTCNRVLR